jgi:hypothetical protein
MSSIVFWDVTVWYIFANDVDKLIPSIFAVKNKPRMQQGGIRQQTELAHNELRTYSSFLEAIMVVL